MTNANTTKQTDNVHPFERKGLGIAPFRFVGMGQEDRLYGQVILNRTEYEKTGIAVTTKPGGMCAFCGTGITNLYNIVSSDGKKFHVGCECVLQTGDAKLVASVKLAKKRADKAKRIAKDAAVKAELVALLADETVRTRLSSMPSRVHVFGKEISMLEHAEWMAERAGATGRAKILKMIKQ